MAKQIYMKIIFVDDWNAKIQEKYAELFLTLPPYSEDEINKEINKYIKTLITITSSTDKES